MSILFITVTAALFAQQSVDGATECYSCVNSTAVSKCSSVVSCNIGEICFADHMTTVSGPSISLGCMPAGSCSSIVPESSGNFSVGGSLIGRSTSAGDCSECCRQNRCNRQLCQSSLQQQQHCSDGGSVNCASVAEFLDVCLDHTHALQTCRRFCGQCSYADGSWSSWFQWSNCDVSCGNGTRFRIRTCTEPSPSGGGKDCSGTSNQTQNCYTGPCPVHGHWSTWSSWGACSATCGNGLQSRDRSCSNPYPSLYGDHCFGDSRDYKMCLESACPGINGGWSVWSVWTNCSATCDTGLQTRQRQCNNPVPSSGGQYCQGSQMDVVLCNKQQCPQTNGGWSVWSVWTDCSTTCDTGVQTRQRQCSNPVPSSGGQYCEGSPVDVVHCIKQHCPQTNGGWSLWSVWSDCSATCDTGVQTRQRQCNNPVPSSGGQYCEGSPVDVVHCNKQHCPRAKSSFRSKDATRLSTGILSFSTVPLNEGSNFDGGSGTFTCQHPGLYFFTVSVVESGISTNLIECYIELNGYYQVELLYRNGKDYTNRMTTDGYGTATGSATLHLRSADRVNIWCQSPTSSVGFSSFTGFLIAGDP